MTHKDLPMLDFTSQYVSKVLSLEPTKKTTKRRPSFKLTYKDPDNMTVASQPRRYKDSVHESDQNRKIMFCHFEDRFLLS